MSKYNKKRYKNLRDAVFEALKLYLNFEDVLETINDFEFIYVNKPRADFNSRIHVYTFCEGQIGANQVY